MGVGDERDCEVVVRDLGLEGGRVGGIEGDSRGVAEACGELFGLFEGAAGDGDAHAGFCEHLTYGVATKPEPRRSTFLGMVRWGSADLEGVGVWEGSTTGNFEWLMCLPGCRDARCNETNHRYFEFKRVSLYERIGSSRDSASVLLRVHV